MKIRRCNFCAERFQRKVISVCFNCYPASEYGVEDYVDNLVKEIKKELAQ
jgi:hypothetical protein